MLLSVSDMHRLEMFHSILTLCYNSSAPTGCLLACSTISEQFHVRLLVFTSMPPEQLSSTGLTGMTRNGKDGSKSRFGRRMQMPTNLQIVKSMSGHPMTSGALDTEVLLVYM
jgi:hypothetical protein